MIQKVINPEDGWQVVELSQNFLEKENPLAEIPAGEQYVILAIFADRDEQLWNNHWWSLKCLRQSKKMSKR